MKPMEITPEMVQEKKDYCSWKNFPKDRPFLDVVRDDPILFLTHCLGLEPWTWQYLVMRAYMRGERRLAICCSRQIGKTKVIARGLKLWRVLLNKGWTEKPTYKNKSKKTHDGVMSLTEPQSMMIIEEIKELITSGDAYMQNYKDAKGNPIYGKKFISEMIDFKKSTKSKLVTKKGIFSSTSASDVTSFPATDAIRGQTLTGLVVDECAFVDEEIITRAAQPAVRAIGSYQLYISTPDSPKGFFYDIMDPEEKKLSHGFTRFMFDIDAIQYDDPEYHASVIEDLKEMISEGKINTVNREYYCSFESSDNTFFPMDKVRAAMKDDIAKVSMYKEGRVSVGIDFGGKAKSRTIVTVATEPDEHKVSKRIACWRYNVGEDLNLIEDVEENIFPFFNVAQVVVDDCPAGANTISKMEQNGWNIVRFNFNSKSKPDFMDRFRARIAKGYSVSYPDPVLLDEFAGYGELLKPMTKKGTDDCIDSWMMSQFPYMDDNITFHTYTIGGDDGDAKTQFEVQQNHKNHYHGLPRAF